ncbi:phage tail protein [Pseudomonas sp. GX19020]|uniref:phage tail protein n=1 Tax=Pseudomonas sp. GX19020 TaxID=2942277 RepID=UPI00201A08A8|nr:phage tail protein [Pseudomonas sp. GX19020]MCL4065350.1 phage tail protein [Pseudomonas sp. GX19020]
MRKLLLATTAIIGILTGGPAAAEPVSLVVALMSGGATFGAAMTAVFGTVGMAAIQLGLSVILSAGAAALAGKPDQQVQRGELTRPTSLPPYRFMYGTGWSPGTPVAWHVSGRGLYVCWLLNSRPSALTSHTVLLDKRPVPAVGNPFDFSGPGASGTGDTFGNGHFTYWIGRGDQTSCPDYIVATTGGAFLATDAWQGRTVIWAIMDSGNPDQRNWRWPATPPELNVEGDWSLIWDPRDNSYSASSNQALVTLDALMNNPIRPYLPDYLRIDTFAWAADVADQRVAVKAGGTIPRYRADGVLVWSSGSELEDQLQPLLAAGAARLVRIGGQLGIVPAVARPAVHTIRDFTDGQEISLTSLQPGDSISSEAVASYAAADRAYELAEAPVFIVPGAAEADGGLPRRLDLRLDFVNDHRQAQRLAKIAVMQSRMQRSISCELFPDAFVLVAGSVAEVDLPAPFSRWNGLYDVSQISPAAGLNDDSSITLRLPVVLQQTSAEIFAWDAATEEQVVEGAALDPWVATLQPPEGVTLVSGGDAADITEAGAITPRVMLSWSRPGSSSLLRYEWQYMTEIWRSTGGGSEGSGGAWVWPGQWTSGGTVGPEDGSEARIPVYVVPVALGRQYRARVRGIGVYGESDWVEVGPVIATAPTRIVAVPSILMAIGGIGRVDLTLRQANDANAVRIELAANSVNLIGGAAIIADIPLGANVTVASSEGSLGSGVTRYYWLRARDSLGNASAWSAVANATTT